MYRYFIMICLLFVNVSVGFAQPLVNISEEEALVYDVSQMSLEERVGQLFMAAFRQEDGRPVTTATRVIKAELQKYHLGGVILFGENFINIEQTVKLTMDLQQAAGPVPLFIAVDQEGGRVNRFHFGTNLPGNMALGATRKVSNAYIAGNILGKELAALGINIDLAPVLDINSNQDNPVIGIRSFGADEQVVTKMGAAYIQGLHAGGVMAAIKHFPGHGDTSMDSHLDLPIVLYGKSHLNELEIEPFRENLSVTDMVMAAHIAFPELDDTKVISKKDGQPVFLPASLSHKILTDLLRKSLGYDGVIITDALEMKAITEHFGPEKAVVGAIQAGADILLMPSDLPKAYAGVMEAINKGIISEERINESVKRILRLKHHWITPQNTPRSMLLAAAQSIVGSKQDKEQEEKMAYEAVTLLKNEESTLPLSAKRDSKIIVAAPRSEMLNSMREALLMQIKASEYQDVTITAIPYENLGGLTTAQKTMIGESDTIILATYSSTLASRTPVQTAEADFAAALTQYADLAKKKVIVIATGTPYDILYLQGAKAYLAVYGTNSANIQAGMAAVFGSLNPSGRLPVPIQDQGKSLFPIGYGLNY
jgi:beta-N-acetylhexosaminidase